MTEHYYINRYMADENTLIGMEEDAQKIKGIAEFRFTDKESPNLQFSFDIAVVKKQEPNIIINNDRRNKQSKSRKTATLF